MFTGLIEELGSIQSRSGSGTKRLTIAATGVTRELKAGDSVSVNGVCLTALDITPTAFQADLAEETIARTSLGQLALGTAVNLELPARAGARLGGHIVQGHVDGRGKLISLERIGKNGSDNEDWKLVIELPAGLEKYVVAKGSIAIDGISLTVAKIEGRILTIAIIPHTYAVTNLKSLQRGDPVNIEVDVMAKYAEKAKAEVAGGITIERLISEGF
jgi:riboflavin synthase